VVNPSTDLLHLWSLFSVYPVHLSALLYLYLLSVSCFRGNSAGSNENEHTASTSLYTLYFFSYYIGVRCSPLISHSLYLTLWNRHEDKTTCGRACLPGAAHG
jgi:hypothetical protein